jgi:hypothetical protein
MSDVAPLTGVRVAVPDADADAALRHARRLLVCLGADVVDRADAETACVVESREGATGAHQDWARSGAMMLTGHADGPPLLAPGAPASALRGALLVFDALTSLRGLASKPLPGVQVLGERAAIAGLSRQGPRSVGGSFRPIETRDGWAGLSLARSADFDLMAALVESAAHGDEWTAVQSWAATRTSEEVATRAQLLGLAGVRLDVPADQPTLFTFARGATAHRRQSPLVVDLSALWAGPLCAHLLGLAGTRVVKVESVHRPDGARRGPAAFYDLLHEGHESVALDFASAAGRGALEGLIRKADVVLESSRPRAMRQLGVDAGSVVAGGTTWASITAYGRSGPRSNHVGYGDDVAATAGLVVPDNGVPMPCGDAIADPLAGAHAAVAIAAALLNDDAFLIDVSMYDVAAATLELTDGSSEAVEAAPPVARAAAGRAADVGQHTGDVLRELGID